MSNQLELLRQQLQEKANAANKRSSPSGDNALYPFWNAQTDTTTTVRFLPDGGNEENPFFWVERRVIKLTFDGIIGRPEYANKEVSVTVPCMKMYDNKLRCPVLEAINPFWNTDLHDTARKFYPKRTFIMQGFVRGLPNFINGKEDVAPENPIRRFTVNQSLFKNIQQAILDPEMRNMPTDYENGTDFRIIKTQQGQYASYHTSNFARSETPLTAEEVAAIDQYGLFNLKEFLPNRPSEEGVAVIEEMFHASLAGLPYDPKWSEHFRPYGVDFGNTGGQSAPAPQQQAVPQQSAPAPQPQQAAPAATTPPWESQQQTQQAEPQSGGMDDPNDALARLRAQVQKSQ